jgi:Outer membrane lipoprotein carrier protein LolA-like
LNMHANPMRFARRCLSALVLLCAMLPVAATGAGWDIDQLMQALAQAKPGRAAFVEKKYIAMLDRPVESSGELSYTPPDRLEKRVVRPKPERMLVEGDTLTLERGQQKHSVKLQEYPELVAFIDSIRGTLAGDRKLLERSFRLRLEGSAANWTLALTPADATVGRNVHLIRVAGVKDEVRSIEIIQTDGDRSVMSIDRIKGK